MPNIITEGLARTAGYLVSESASMYRSRDQFVIDGDTGGILAGTVLGKLTADDSFVPHVIAGADGSEDVAGILYESLAPGEEALRTVTTRDAEVNGAHLIYPAAATAPQIAAINAALATLGIIVR